MPLTREQIAEKCKTLIPHPEHGPDQYLVVIDYLIKNGADEGCADLCAHDVMTAAEIVLSFMNEV